MPHRWLRLPRCVVEDGWPFTLAGELQSARSRSYANDLRRRLEPYKSEPIVIELNEQTKELALA